ncbi:MAG: alpha-glucuronidase, partial [Lachnospiraceae bacterium]|nr:alpha-glucuronidase [Lachnospiraceae bacterium]
MKDYASLWLGYKAKKNNRDCSCLRSIHIAGADETDECVKNAVSELKSGLKIMLDIEPEFDFGPGAAPIQITDGKSILDSEEYKIFIDGEALSIEAKSGAGILYAAFDILRVIACEKSVEEAYASSKTVRPSNPLRMLNHWDNMDGSIERGYSGESFFYVDNEIVIDERTVDYARLIASVGINAVVINNVNVKDAASYMITDRYFDKLA